MVMKDRGRQKQDSPAARAQGTLDVCCPVLIIPSYPISVSGSILHARTRNTRGTRCLSTVCRLRC